MTATLNKNKLQLLHIAAGDVATPATGEVVLFFDTDNDDHLSAKDEAGTVTDLQAGGGVTDAADLNYTPGTSGNWDTPPTKAAPAFDELASRVKAVEGGGGGGGAPDNAKYIVAEASAGLSAEVNLGALADGILMQTVSAGVSTPAIATPGTDYLAPDSASYEVIQDMIATFLAEGANIAFSYNDAGDALTIAVTGLTSAQISDFNEAVDDRVGALAVEGSGIDIVYDDTGGTLSITIDTAVVATLTGTQTLTNKKFDDGIVVNEAGADADTRIEGDTDVNLLFVDAGQDAVGIGTATPDSKAKFQVDSTTKGMLIPRMTTTQRNAITSPPDGLVIYNTTTHKFSVYENGSWVELGTGGGGGGSSGVLFKQTADAQVTGTSEGSMIGTGVGSTELASDQLQEGTTVVIDIMGIWSSDGSAGNGTIRAKLGGTNICVSANNVLSSGISSQAFSIRIIITCRTIGPTGTVRGQGMVHMYRSTNLESVYGVSSTADVEVDTTGTLDIDVTFQNDNSGNTITATNVLIQVLD